MKFKANQLSVHNYGIFIYFLFTVIIILYSFRNWRQHTCNGSENGLCVNFVFIFGAESAREKRNRNFQQHKNNSQTLFYRWRITCDLQSLFIVLFRPATIQNEKYSHFSLTMPHCSTAFSFQSQTFYQIECIRTLMELLLVSVVARACLFM